MTANNAEVMSARLEHLAWSWRQGAPIRVGELQVLLSDVQAVAEASDVPELQRLAAKITALIAALNAARQHAETELAAIPSRKRAMRAHARSADTPAGTHLRRRA